MKCSFCGHQETKVIDSRMAEEGGAIRRRRECLKCKQRFTTYERVEEVPLTVIKRSGQHEPFDRSKLLNGLLRATVKREVPLHTLEKIVTGIEQDLRNRFKYEVKSSKLGEMVLRRLRRIDKVAYVRFASVYRQFDDVGEFTEELGKFQKTLKR